MSTISGNAVDPTKSDLPLFGLALEVEKKSPSAHASEEAYNICSLHGKTHLVVRDDGYSREFVRHMKNVVATERSSLAENSGSDSNFNQEV